MDCIPRFWQNSWIVFPDFEKLYMDNFHFLKEVTEDIEPEGFAVSFVPDDGRQDTFRPVVFTLFFVLLQHIL